MQHLASQLERYHGREPPAWSEPRAAQWWSKHAAEVSRTTRRQPRPGAPATRAPHHPIADCYDGSVVGDIERVFEALNRAHVRYLVAGGVAVVLHGYLRTTADLDLIVQLEPENTRRALRVLGELGYEPRAPVPSEQFADAGVRERWIRDKGLEVFSLWSRKTPGLEVDLFVREPFDFDHVYESAHVVQLETTTVRPVPRLLLIEMKKRVGRPRDLEDVEALEQLAPEAGDRRSSG